MNGELFVGRDRELSRLRSLLDGLAVGVGGVVLVEGEQGIGKTALLRRTLGGAEQAGCALAWGSAVELAQRFPLWLMTECLRANGQEADGGGARGRAGGRDADGQEQAAIVGVAAAMAGLVPPGDPVAAGIEGVLAQVDLMCARSPVVLVAEDLQWADEASVLVWERLALAVGQLPLLLAGSLRPGPATDELHRLRRGLLARGGTVLSLGPLAPQEMSELAGRLAGGRPGRRLAGLVRRAAGNPLYAQELVDALTRDGRVLVTSGVAELADLERPEVPESLAGMIDRRLRSLPGPLTDVLRWAAVLGPEFAVTDLSAVAGISAGQLMNLVGQAVAAGVIGDAVRSGAAGAGPRLAFRHGLIHQVLYDQMPEALRTALHADAARALAVEGAPAERVAAQLLMASPAVDAWVFEWLADAAPTLASRAPQVAAQLLRGALDRLPDDDGRREALEAAFVMVAFLQVMDEEVEQIGGRLQAGARDPNRAATAAWQVGYSLVRTGRGGESVSALEKAMGRPDTSDVWTARLLALHSYAKAIANHPDTEDAAQKALIAAKKAGDRFAAGYALHTLCLVKFFNRDTTAVLGHLDDGLEIIGDDPLTTDLRLLLLSYRAHVLEHLDRHAEAGTVIREALALAERLGTPRMATICHFAADYYFKVGLWDDALAVLGQATLAAREQAALSDLYYNPLFVHGLIALIAGHRYEQETAEEHLEAVRGHEFSSAFDQAAMRFLLLAQALAAEQAGRPGDAVAVLSVCIDRTVKMPRPYRHMVLPTLVRLALATGDSATAAAAAKVAAREAERDKVPIKNAGAGWCQGLLDGDPGPLLAAAGHYQFAGRPLEQGLVLEDAAVLLAGRGDLQSARRVFGQAVTVYRDLGARWDIRRAATRLRDYGIRPSSYGRRPTTGWRALTPTETKIAYLIARGQSNPEIAGELWLSRNTVQSHVSSILAKLSARSRAEVAREALTHPVGDRSAV